MKRGSNKVSILNKASTAVRPSVFSYHDVSSFLTDWFEYRKSQDSTLTLRGFAKSIDLSFSYFSMVLSGQRPLKNKAFEQIKGELNLTPEELKFFNELRKLADGFSQDEKIKAFEELQKLKAYYEKNAEETETFGYLTSFLNIAIREMTRLKGFRLDTDWIKEKLAFKASTKKIEEALDFLLEKGFLKKTENGVETNVRTIQCEDVIFKLALAENHRIMLDLAKSSIENHSSNDRNLRGCTLSVSQESYQQVVGAIEECIKKIEQIEANDKNDADRVLQVEIAAFPLALLRESSDE